MGIHDDHRKRIRAVYLEKGADALDDVHLLELYLFYTNPRADVNPLANSLITQFGSLDGVFSAEYKELCAVSGVGENTAVLLTMLKPLYRRAALSAVNSNLTVKSLDDAAEYLEPYFFGLSCEKIYLLCMTSTGRVLRCVCIGTGSVNKAEFNAEKAVSTAIESHASCVILAHNHVNGESRASEADLLATKNTAEALNRFGIQLLDHLIFADDSYCSLKECGLYCPSSN